MSSHFLEPEILFYIKNLVYAKLKSGQSKNSLAKITLWFIVFKFILFISFKA
jgi:hypothetical protein